MSIFPGSLTLKRRALSELTKAFEESRGELSCDWVRNGDLDLASLRNDHALQLVLRRYCGAKPESPTDDDDWRDTMTSYQLEEEQKGLRGYPARPWGDPERRATGWALLAVASAEGALLGLYAVLDGTDTGAEWAGLLILIALAVLAIARGVFAWRETRRSDADGQARRLTTTTESGGA